jgi:hypothetical protein
LGRNGNGSASVSELPLRRWGSVSTSRSSSVSVLMTVGLRGFYRREID